MKSFLLNTLSFSIAVGIGVFSFQAFQKLNLENKDNISFVGRANFLNSEVQFSEVKGNHLVCMVAFHTNTDTKTLLANMQCKGK